MSLTKSPLLVAFPQSSSQSVTYFVMPVLLTAAAHSYPPRERTELEQILVKMAKQGVHFPILVNTAPLVSLD